MVDVTTAPTIFRVWVCCGSRSGPFHYRARKTLISTVMRLLWLFLFKDCCKCSFAMYRYKQKYFRKETCFLLASWQPLTTTAGSGSVSQWYKSGSVPKYRTDPQHWYSHIVLCAKKMFKTPCCKYWKIGSKKNYTHPVPDGFHLNPHTTI